MFNLAEIGRIATAGRHRNQELSPEARAAICGAAAAGASQRAIATAFGVSQAVITQTIQRLQETQSFKSKPRNGRPKVFSRRESRYIVQLAKRDARLTHKQLLKMIGAKASVTTVRRALRERNYRKWRAAKRIPLTKETAMARYDFARYWLGEIEELEAVCCS
jgi:transposase